MADTPTAITQYQTGFAPEVAPYAQDLLGRAEALTTQTPYQPYQGEQVAQFSPLQQRSYDYAQQLTSAPQLQDATAMAGLAGLGALNTQYTFDPYAAKSFTDQGTAQQYMSPYMQNVVDVQQQQAKRQADIQGQMLGAQAARAGAFGGGRDAIMRAQANAELQRNLQGIQATGLQNAYQQAQQQFNTEQQQRQAAQQLNAQQQQFGAGLGMQGLQTALQGAGALGSLGQTQYSQNVGMIGLQNQLGLQQQQQAQNVLNAQYQNFLNQQNYPYKNLAFMSDIIRGVPLSQTGATAYQAAPTGMQNLASLGLGAYGLSSLFGGKAAGGEVKSYADGGSVTSREFKEYAVDNVPSQMLPLVQRNAQARADMDTQQLAMEKMAQDAALRRGVSGALPPGVNVVRAAGGGILAFPVGGSVDSEDPDQGQVDAGQLVTTDSAPSPGNPRLQQAYGDRLLRIIDRMEADKGYVPLTPQERQLAEQTAFKSLQLAAGPDIYAPMQKRIAEEEAGRAGNLEQAKGLAALKAAAAVLQPGGTMRGLAAAGATFGDAYGQAMQADRAEKRYLSQMQFQLADAQRKERLGFTKEARADVQAAEQARYNAVKAQQTRDAAIATALGRGMQATRPVGGAGAGKTPKVAEQLADAETAYENNPSEANLKRVTALRRTMAQTKTSDIGKTKADLTREGQVSQENAKVQAAMNKFKYEPAYLEARQAGPEEADRVWQEELARQRQLFGRENPSLAPVNKNSPKAGGKVLQFDAKGNLIPD